MIAGQIGTPSLSLLSAAHHAVEGYSEVIFCDTEVDNRHWLMKYCRLISNYRLLNLQLMPRIVLVEVTYIVSFLMR
jgi:hypothetical protein